MRLRGISTSWREVAAANAVRTRKEESERGSFADHEAATKGEENKLDVISLLWKKSFISSLIYVQDVSFYTVHLYNILYYVFAIM